MPFDDDEEAKELIYAVKRIAEAITPIAVPGTDASGGTVDSLTEAVMGMTSGLVRIADAIEGIAISEAIENVAYAIENLAEAIKKGDKIKNKETT